MNRHVIYGMYGEEDNFIPPLIDGEIKTKFDLLTSAIDIKTNKRIIRYGIGQAINRLSDFDIYPTEIGIDILVLAAHVYAADTRIARITESQDGWTREIRLIVPVSDPRKWTEAAPIFMRMLNFLTGDKWSLVFRSRPHNATCICRTHCGRLFRAPFDYISLFSGGLDSLIGAIDTLEKGYHPLFISHASDSITSDAQTRLFAKLKSHYPRTKFEHLRLWMKFPNEFIAGISSENTTRGRSFLFFALGVFAASGLGHHFSLKVPENGLIAINVPLHPLRLGALSTRTTHPFYIARWNEALNSLGINGCIENPYWNKTKGEMITECANLHLLEEILSSSLSCSSPTKGRWLGIGSQHCGYCVPCIVRRSAIHASPLRDTTTYTSGNLLDRVLDTRKAEGEQLRSFQIAINRLKNNPGLANVLIHKAGPLRDESFDRQINIAGVYSRGLKEVENFIKDIQVRPK